MITYSHIKVLEHYFDGEFQLSSVFDWISSKSQEQN